MKRIFFANDLVLYQRLLQLQGFRFMFLGLLLYFPDLQPIKYFSNFYPLFSGALYIVSILLYITSMYVNSERRAWKIFSGIVGCLVIFGGIYYGVL